MVMVSMFVVFMYVLAELAVVIVVIVTIRLMVMVTVIVTMVTVGIHLLQPANSDHEGNPSSKAQELGQAESSWNILLQEIGKDRAGCQVKETTCCRENEVVATCDTFQYDPRQRAQHGCTCGAKLRQNCLILAEAILYQDSKVSQLVRNLMK